VRSPKIEVGSVWENVHTEIVRVALDEPDERRPRSVAKVMLLDSMAGFWFAGVLLDHSHDAPLFNLSEDVAY